jgi:hypothetical protein
VETELSAAPESAPTGKEDKIFLTRGHEFQKPADTERHQPEEVTILHGRPFRRSSNPLDLAEKKRRQDRRAHQAVHPLRNYSLRPLGNRSGHCYQVLRCQDRERSCVVPCWELILQSDGARGSPLIRGTAGTCGPRHVRAKTWPPETRDEQSVNVRPAA